MARITESLDDLDDPPSFFFLSFLHGPISTTTFVIPPLYSTFFREDDGSCGGVQSDSLNSAPALHLFTLPFLLLVVIMRFYDIHCLPSLSGRVVRRREIEHFRVYRRVYELPKQCTDSDNKYLSTKRNRRKGYTGRV